MPIQTVVPSWEDPVSRFLNGLGELQISTDGPAFTLREALVHFEDSRFPIKIRDRELSKPELLARAADIFNAGAFDRAECAVGRDGSEKIKDLCRQAGRAQCF
jgi:hypothetical protein